MKKTLITVAILTAANPALAVNYGAWTAPELLQRWMVLNEDCRRTGYLARVRRAQSLRRCSVRPWLLLRRYGRDVALGEGTSPTLDPSWRASLFGDHQHDDASRSRSTK
jgi:hypothetical protein